MSHYIYCPKCKDDSLDVDTLSCACGYCTTELNDDEVAIRKSDLEEAIEEIRIDTELLELRAKAEQDMPSREILIWNVSRRERLLSRLRHARGGKEVR